MYTCPDTGRQCYDETMDPNYSPSEEARWLDACRQKGREWAYANPETAACLDRGTFEQEDAATENAEKAARSIFRLYSNEEIDEFLEGAREMAAA